MHQERSSYPKFPIHEKALPASDVVCWSGKLDGTPKRDQSLFSLLLEIESQLRKEDRINAQAQIGQCYISKAKVQNGSMVEKLSRYIE